MKNFALLATTLLLSTSASAEPRQQCSDFKTQAAAQKFYDKAKVANTTDWKSLDRDGAGRACDCLPGGNGQNCPNAKD